MNRMKQLITIGFVLFLMLSQQSLMAQNTSGTITFERKTYWIEIMSRLPWITQEDVDRDRLTWGKMQGKYGSPHSLKFTQNVSVYEPVEEESESGYNWRQDELKLIRDFENNTSKDVIETLDKKYVIEGEMPKYKWKILNEIKEINGYLCMKAETTDPIKKQVIHAWFTDAIPVQSGPEGYCGLPGMILGININDGCVIIEATEVSISEKEIEIEIPKKIKGKKVTREKYESILKKFIDDSYTQEKNPYWRIRY